MIHMAIITRQMVTGGVEKALTAMLKRFDFEEVSVDLYVEKTGGAMMDTVPTEVCVYRLESPGLKNGFRHPVTSVRKLAALLKLKYSKNDYLTQNYLSCKMLLPLKKKYDVAIAYHAPNTVPMFYVIDKISAGKKVLWLHGDLETNGGTEKLAVRYYRKYDQVFAVSENVSESFLRSCPEMRARTYVFYNFADAQEMYSMARSGPSFEDDFEGIRILTVGRLVWQKGIDFAISVCGKLIERGYHIRWYVCGEGEQRFALEELIREKHLEKDFILLGNQKNPYGYMKDCDLYVQPSRFEGYCTTTNEARTFGKPVITTDVSGAREQFVDGKTGWIVGIDEDEIFRQICWCLEHRAEVDAVRMNLKKYMEENELAVGSRQIQELLLS